ncbi:MAG: TetR family transcriptional regulator [Clostridia bacterium]|nr:TetR family transcriptional regulator [Clostridia bacterium]
MSLREIARRINVSKSAVIYHFEKAEKIIKSFF